MSAKTARNLGIRLDNELASRLARFEERTGIEGVTLARRSLESALDYFEAHNSITFPLKTVPEGTEKDKSPKGNVTKFPNKPSRTVESEARVADEEP